MRNIYFEKYTLETTCKINVACEEAVGGVTRIHARAATHARWTEKEIVFLPPLAARFAGHKWRACSQARSMLW